MLELLARGNRAGVPLWARVAAVIATSYFLFATGSPDDDDSPPTGPICVDDVDPTFSYRLTLGAIQPAQDYSPSCEGIDGLVEGASLELAFEPSFDTSEACPRYDTYIEGELPDLPWLPSDEPTFPTFLTRNVIDVYLYELVPDEVRVARYWRFWVLSDAEAVSLESDTRFTARRDIDLDPSPEVEDRCTDSWLASFEVIE